MAAATHQELSRPWPVLLLGGLSLLAGLDAGLVRLGVWAPVASVRLSELHGSVMVLGFLGTVIALERARALRQAWASLAPALIGAGSLWLVLGLPPLTGQLLVADGAAVFVAVMVTLWLRSRSALIAVQVLAAVVMLTAAALLTVRSVVDLVPVLACFVVVTIAAERAELAQLSMGSGAITKLVAWSTGCVLTAILGLAWPVVLRGFGVVLVGIAGWLFFDDIARRTVRTPGLPRLSAVAMLAGHGWLVAAGVGWLLLGPPSSSYQLDFVVHTVFLGFAMSMVIAHAPVILPAVTGLPVPYRRCCGCRWCCSMWA